MLRVSGRLDSLATRKEPKEVVEENIKIPLGSTF